MSHRKYKMNPFEAEYKEHSDERMPKYMLSTENSKSYNPLKIGISMWPALCSFVVRSAMEPASLLLLREEVCLYVFVFLRCRPLATFGPFRRPSRSGTRTTLHQLKSNGLATTNDLLIDWCHRHYADDGT